MSSLRHRLVSTSHGLIAVEDDGGAGVPFVLIHGNSACRSVFVRQAESELARKARLITFDLPAHGQSDDALEPARSYTLHGLADATIELLAELGVSEAVVLGWSLGGHIGIEMLSRFRGIRGLVITGTPPIPKGGFAEGFVGSPHQSLPSRRHLSHDQVDAFARMIFGDPVEPFLREAIARTDGRFREQLFQSALAGENVDQRLAVEGSRVPIAVINGSADPLIKLDYIDSVAYGNLWDGRCHRLKGVGHAPFWRAASEFNAVVGRFLDDLMA
ncbi:alpha/beta fold hydrolase [Arenibaculum pallidiluteum]|uniref:alpha/beta fold hydrolase n=1 Tax=Arenibaculum pallidiluteum TaxID=2812559 RepID=UPI001A963177|nr:alpha/beta fold hydrolase [Arenibaculum pallidiluteum]